MSAHRRARAVWAIVEVTDAELLIRDVGHDTGRPSVTNDAEAVVADLVAAAVLGDRRLLYIDSDGDVDEIVVRGGKFEGFNPRGPIPEHLRKLMDEKP